MIYAARLTSNISTKVLNVASVDYVSPVDDGSGAVTTWFRPILGVPPALTRRLGVLTGGRRGVISAGRVELMNDAGALDSYPGGVFWNYGIEIRRGAAGLPWADLDPFFNGRVTQATGTLSRVYLDLIDPTYNLQTELQPTFYAGSGGLEGGPELANVPKPLLYGVCRNVQPVLVDAANLKYQVHAGQINAVTAVYVNGSAWTYDASPSAGEYTYDLSTGIITLGSTPPGVVTADVEGAANGSYAEDLDDIVKKILVDRAGFTDPDDFGSMALATVPFGFYFTEKVTVAGALDQLAAAGGFWWGFDRAGLFQAAQLGTLRTVTAPVLDRSLILSIACLESPVPVYRVGVDYARTWRVLTDDEVAGAVTATERQRLTRAASTVTTSGVLGALLKTLTANRAAQLNIPGCFAAEADAQDIADDLFTYFKAGYSEWQVLIDLDDSPSALALVDLGDSVTVQIDRFQMSAGRTFFVDSITDAGSRLTLGLVG